MSDSERSRERLMAIFAVVMAALGLLRAIQRLREVTRG
jgi:hypothetical protein